MNTPMILFIIWAVQFLMNIVQATLKYEPTWLEVFLPETVLVLYLLTEAIK